MVDLTQLAKEIGINKQALYKRVTGTLRKPLGNNIKKINNKYYINDKGIDIVKEAYTDTSKSYKLYNDNTVDNSITSIDNNDKVAIEFHILETLREVKSILAEIKNIIYSNHDNTIIKDHIKNKIVDSNDNTIDNIKNRFVNATDEEILAALRQKKGINQICRELKTSKQRINKIKQKNNL